MENFTTLNELQNEFATITAAIEAGHLKAFNHPPSFFYGEPVAYIGEYNWDMLAEIQGDYPKGGTPALVYTGGKYAVWPNAEDFQTQYEID